MTTVTVQHKTEITFAAETDVGRSRQGQPNQDSFGVYEDYCNDQERLAAKGKLFVVADGMGGAAGGREASRIAVEVLFHSYYADPDADIVAGLGRALQAANAKIHQHGLTHPELRGLGTTIVVAVIRGNTLVVANVGDSRAYLLRQEQLYQLSLDHTAVQEQVREGLLTPEEGATHPRRHVLSRNLGFRPKADPDFDTQTLRKDDLILLCSDGLWGTVEDDEIAAVLGQTDCETAVDTLINLANERGGPDNISGIVIHVAGVEQLPVAPVTDSDGQAAQQHETVALEPIASQITDSSTIESAAMRPAPASIERPAAAVDAVQPLPSRRMWLTGVAVIALVLLGAAVYGIASMLGFPANPRTALDPPRAAVTSSSPPISSQGAAATLPNQTSAITAAITPTATLRPTPTALPPTPTATLRPTPTSLLPTPTTRPPTPAPSRPPALSSSPIGTMILRPGAAQTAALSADGQLLATGSSNGSITLWRTEDKIEQVSFMVKDVSGLRTIHSLAFSADNKLLAAALDNGTVQLWEIPAEIKTNAPCRCLMGDPLIFPDAGQALKDPVLSVVFASDKHLTIASRDGIVKLWDIGSRQETPLKSTQYDVHDIAVSADGATLAVVDTQGKLHVTEQDIDTSQRYTAGAAITHVAVSENGQTLAVVGSASDKDNVTVWHNQKVVPTEINGAIASVALSSSGRYLTVALQEGEVKWFDLVDMDEPSVGSGKTR
ncbi:MAG TPA: protein phosphatase 2C domain-containing protein [Herpetosiphonaceae bacterium]